jgi:bacillopeptidase F
MNNSRLARVRSRKAGKQGMIYLFIAILLIVITIIWGLPAVARLTGLLIKSDNNPVVFEDQKPTPPIFSDIPEATFSGQVKIAGYAQPGLDVILFLNGAEYERKLVAESGTFSFDKVVVVEGDNTVYAYTSTLHELRSEQSKVYVIVVDTTKPSVTIDSPKDGEVFRGQAQRIPNIVGSVNEIGSKVYVGDRMTFLQDGKFSLSYQLVEGDQDIMIRAIDKAGNESISSIRLRWEP